MSQDSKYKYQKRIKELECENSRLTNKLYQYRTSALEIFDGLTDVNESSINKNWILKRLRKCFL